MNAHALVCTCGSLRFIPNFNRAPMRWWLTCKHCGKEHPTAWVAIKPFVARPVPKYPPYQQPYFPYGEF